MWLKHSMYKDESLKKHYGMMTARLLSAIRVDHPGLMEKINTQHMWHATRMLEYPLALQSAPPKGDVFDVGSAKRWSISLLELSEVTRLTRWHTFQDTVCLNSIPVSGLGILPSHGVFELWKEKLRMYWCLPEHLPDEPESSDVVYNISVMEHVEPENFRKWMDQSWARLKPGGHYFLSCDYYFMLDLGDGKADFIFNHDLRQWFDSIDAELVLGNTGELPWHPDYDPSSVHSKDLLTMDFGGPMSVYVLCLRKKS